MGLPRPTGLKATLNGDNSITLDWDNYSPGFKFKIYETKSLKGVEEGKLFTESRSTRGPFKEYRKYSYWVTAVNPRTLEESAPSWAQSFTYKNPNGNGVPPSKGGPITPPPVNNFLPAGQVVGDLKWRSDEESGKLIRPGNFKSTDWNVEPKGGAVPWPPEIVIAPGRVKAVRYHLDPRQKRQELEPDHRTFGNSERYFFAFSFYLADDFPIEVNDWQVIWQLHGNDTDSPRFALQVRNHQLRIGDNVALANLEKERWYRPVIETNFPRGEMTVWLDHTFVGTRQVGQSRPNYYLKHGYYRNPAIARAGTIYEADHTLATGYGAAFA